MLETITRIWNMDTAPSTIPMALNMKVQESYYFGIVANFYIPSVCVRLQFCEDYTIFQLATLCVLGLWVEDLRQGHGLYTYPNGDAYEGEWLHHMRYIYILWKHTILCAIWI